jgi:hypothetical protein
VFGQRCQVAGSRIVCRRSPTVTGTVTTLDSRMSKSLRGVDKSHSSGGSNRSADATIRAAPSHPARSRISIATTPRTYIASAAPDTVTRGAGARIGAGWCDAGDSIAPPAFTAAASAPADTPDIMSGRASRRSVRADANGGSATAVVIGTAMAGTTRTSAGIRSIAASTAVHEAWRTAAARTRQTASALPTSTAAANDLTEAPASIQNQVSFISASSLCAPVDRVRAG